MNCPSRQTALSNEQSEATVSDQKPKDELNLDLIQMVQKARKLHDANARPSELAAVYWIEVKSGAQECPAPKSSAGEWRVPLTAANVDDVWERVKALTLAGELGYKSKVSTRPAAGQADPDERLLCVRTYDADDIVDVERVGAALRAIGLKGLEYAADKA